MKTSFSLSRKSLFLTFIPISNAFYQPQATVMFADIVGFTAWSSVREPTQVFILLESVYHAFDEIARRRRVFKGTTTGRQGTYNTTQCYPSLPLSLRACFL